jgi:hypothetical protein
LVRHIDGLIIHDLFKVEISSSVVYLFYPQMAYLSVLKICKLLFAVAGHSLVHMVADACQPESTSTVSPVIHNQVNFL